SPPRSQSFLRDGRLLVLCDNGQVLDWDGESNQLQPGVQVKLTSGMLWVGIAPRGDLLAAADGSPLVTVWDLGRGQELSRTNVGGTQGTGRPVFAPDGRIVAVGNHDHTVAVWEPRTGQLLQRLQGHRQQVTQIAFRADGQVLVSASEDGTLRWWDVASG